MKHISNSILLLLAFVSCATHEPRRLGTFDSDIHHLKHEIGFYRELPNKELCLIATLTNASEEKTRVMVDNQMLSSKLTVNPATGEKFEVYEKDYLELLRTATWWDPTVELNAGGTIRWKIPLSSLVTSQGQSITEESLKGATITSELKVSGITL